ncbi:MAG TPA: tetratricopeptide repeat protein [Candidatus Binatia bacterium]|nr:tetratricopeptide repeat protein [Candidatus Binatia bacterium]
MASVGVQVRAAVQSPAVVSRDSRARALVLGLLLVIVTLAVYSPVHSHPFTNIDDPKYVLNNVHISSGVTFGTIFWAFTHGYSGNWHPLTWISHAIDLQIFGTDAGLHHDENVLLHALDAVLLFWVLKRATGYAGRSFTVAALFALHPVNVESVAWIAERKTMLSTLFCLAALGAYRWYASRPAWGRYIVVTGLFVLGLMSKPQIIMLPLVLPLWDYWPLQRVSFGGGQSPQGPQPIPVRSFRSLVVEKTPLFFICLVDAGVTMIAQHVAGEAQPYPLWLRIGNAVVSYTRYMGKAFWPTDLALYYPHPGHTLHWWQVGTSTVVLLLITVLAVHARRDRYYLVGWLWFLIMLVPCIGVVQTDVQGMADRYAYVSFIGLFIMVCWGVAEWAAERRLSRVLLPAASIMVMLALAAVTWHQLGYWKDDVTLWSHSAAVTTGNWKAELMLGMALDTEGRYEDALGHFFRAAAIEPNDPFIDLGIATEAARRGSFPMALEYYRKMESESWNSEQRSVALRNMALVYRRMGDTSAADQCLSRINALPQPAVNWQGAWWKQIIPAIERYFRGKNPQG